MTELKKNKWLLADDHSIVRQGIELLLTDMFPDAEVVHASQLQQIQDVLQNHSIDFAIFDAQFPDGNILQILSECKKQNPDLIILIFSSFEEEQYALKFIHAGANGYLSKLADEETLQQALMSLSTDGTYLSDTVQKLILNSLQNPASQNPLNRLTERERQIAQLYAQGLGNLEIANELDLKQNSVSTFKKRILEKLNLKTTLELIDFIRKDNLTI